MVLRISFIVISTTTKQLHQTTVEASCCPTFWLGSDAFTASTSWFNHNLSPPLLKIVARIVRPYTASNTRSSTDSTKESTSSITKSDLKICQVACCSVFPRFEICISVINMITQTLVHLLAFIFSPSSFEVAFCQTQPEGMFIASLRRSRKQDPTTDNHFKSLTSL